MIDIAWSAFKIAGIMFAISAALGALAGLAWIRIQRRRKKNDRTSK